MNDSLEMIRAIEGLTEEEARVLADCLYRREFRQLHGKLQEPTAADQDFGNKLLWDHENKRAAVLALIEQLAALSGGNVLRVREKLCVILTMLNAYLVDGGVERARQSMPLHKNLASWLSRPQ